MKIHAIIIAVTLIVVGTHAATLQTAQGTRKVLTRLALADDLSEALNNAQNSLSNDVMKAAKLNRMNYASEDLQLVDVFFHINTDTTVELTNVKLSNGPEVVITSVKPNLEFLNMAVDFSLGSLEVTGTYEIVSKSVLSVLPATSNGEFTLTLSNVRATGKVGLSLVEDSFSTINYDIKYVPESQFLRTRYQTLDGSILSSISPDVQDIIISEKISRELQNLLNQIVKKQLDNVLCEMSVDELIGDTKMAVTYRAHAREVRAVANEYVDEVLHYVQEYVVQNHVEEIAIPDVEVGFSRTVLWIRWHGEFYTSNGHVRSLASLQRTADVSLEFNNATGAITVFGALGLGELQTPVRPLICTRLSAGFLRGLTREGVFRSLRLARRGSDFQGSCLPFTSLFSISRSVLQITSSSPFLHFHLHLDCVVPPCAALLLGPFFLCRASILSTTPVLATYSLLLS